MSTKKSVVKKEKKPKVEEGHLSVRKADSDYVRKLSETDDKSIRAVFSSMVKLYKEHRAKQEEG